MISIAGGEDSSSDALSFYNKIQFIDGRHTVTVLWRWRLGTPSLPGHGYTTEVITVSDGSGLWENKWTQPGTIKNIWVSP